MPNVYVSGAILPESRGAVRGGLAVALHDPNEVDGLIALCELAPRPPEDPIASLFRALGDPVLNLATWAGYWQDLKRLRAAAGPSTPTPPQPSSLAESDPNHEQEEDALIPMGPLGKLRVALDLAKELWLAQKAEAPKLSLVLLMAEASRTGTTDDLHLDGEGAALVIRPGSLVGEVVRVPLRVTSFAVCLMLGGGTSTTARRTDMVARLRAEAAIGKAPLMDIRELKKSGPGDQKPLAVLIHGLFATDIGTFGALQSRLEEHFKVVGFPHDTLSESIESNGFTLAQHLGVLGYNQVSLIAHSRGGLVARSAAVHLAESNPGLIRRCATFGTPHLGAEMAENAASLIATIAFLKAGVADQSVATVVDMLCCVSELGGFPGIRDLRPASTRDSWLANLQAAEGLYADTNMQLCTVGGAKNPARLMERIAGSAVRRVIGSKPSDLVVAQSSSLPLLKNPGSLRIETHCDHFSYFRDDQAAILDQVVTFLVES